MSLALICRSSVSSASVSIALSQCVPTYEPHEDQPVTNVTVRVLSAGWLH